MTVFRGYLKAIKQSKYLILLYVAIFFSCTLLMQAMAGKTEKSYQAASLKVGIVDEDGSVLSGALGKYLENFHQVVPMENDLSSMQEKLFYRDVEYIVRIPSDFYKKCIQSGEKLQVTTVPDTYSGIYVDQQINSFLNNARTYIAAGFTEDEAAEALIKEVPVQVKLASEDGASQPPRHIYYFRYIPYLFLALFGFVTGNILIIFRKKELKCRMLAAPVSARQQSLEGLLCMILAGTAIYGLVIAAAVLFYGKELYEGGNFGYYLLNTAALFFVSLAVSYLAGTLAPNKDALTGIMNIVSLGICFLCGVFVPLDYMSKGVKTVSQFLPVYWYETANEVLGEFSVPTAAAKQQILQAVVIQVVFGAVFVCLTMVVEKYKSTER